MATDVESSDEVPRGRKTTTLLVLRRKRGPAAGLQTQGMTLETKEIQINRSGAKILPSRRQQVKIAQIASTERRERIIFWVMVVLLLIVAVLMVALSKSKNLERFTRKK